MQGGDAIGKADGLTDVAHPVVRGHDFITCQLAGAIGNQRQGRWVIGDAFCDLAERFQYGIHQRRMEGVGNDQIFDF